MPIPERPLSKRAIGALRRLPRRLQQARVDARLHRQVERMAGPVQDHERTHKPAGPQQPPVVFFNASTRLTRLSLNAAFSLLTSWAVRLEGVPVIHFACRSAMAPCVLGTHRDHPSEPPPCEACMAESRRFFQGADVRWLEETPQPELEAALSGLDLEDLACYRYRGRSPSEAPLGALVLPSLRWILRRHHLEHNAETLHLLRRYILAAGRILDQFTALLEEAQPQAVVVFNGMFFPEAVARWAARQHGVRAISHEVALQPFSAFFTEGEATAYPIDIPDDFDLTPDQDARLDRYLEQRFQGNFSMAGIRFWPQMQSLGPEFWQRAGAYRQIVPVFSNVVFDTSQGHANVVFPHMFAWLEAVRKLVQANPATFFVLRAHPDECRPGKESRESVLDWVQRSRAAELPNLLFVDAGEPFSSYELIQRSKFVMIYNSTIGLEASILGAPVLCGGKARFTQLPTVFFPPTAETYLQQAQAFLDAERIETPPEFQHNARRFLYMQLFRTSLPFGDWIEEDGVWPGFVTLKEFSPPALRPDASPTMRVVLDGILRGKPFLLDE
jgi:hypothetical protein